MIIKTVDALAGSGKTFAAGKYSARTARLGHKTLFVQPTKDLISETIKDIRKHSPDIRLTAIHSGTTENVLATLVQHTRAASEHQGEILFITHASFLRLPYFHNAGEWHVIVDEVFQADQGFDFNMPYTHGLITRAFEVVPHNAEYGRVIPSDLSYLDTVSRNRLGDEMYTKLSTFAATVQSPHWETFVLDSTYQRLIRDERNGKSKLLAFAVLQPSILEPFRTVTVMGACFRESMLYRLWINQGVRFETHRAIESQVRYTTHPNDNLLTILYLFDGAWSKNQRNKIIEGDEGTCSVIDACVPLIRAEFANEPFLWLGNKDLPADYMGDGIRLPNQPHGLNTYQHINNCVVLSALNPNPSHFKFLASQGVDGDEVRDSYYHQAIYQAYLRTAERDLSSRAEKKLIVMDKQAADWLLTLFPRARVGRLGSRIKPVSNPVGRPKKHADAAARQRACRERKRLRNMLELDAINGTTMALTTALQVVPNIGQIAHPGLAAIQAMKPESMTGTETVSIFASIYSTEPSYHLDYENVDEFIAALKGVWREAIGDKEDNILLSPATFDATLSEDTSRGKANVRYIRGLWLDNDGGDLPYGEFAKLFPRLRMVCMNTFSTAPGNERYRVFIPTTHAMTVAVHAEIMGQIERIMNNAGYFSDKQAERSRDRAGIRKHGFDLSKFVPNSLFYAPSQASDPAHSFFKEFKSDGREALDPYFYVNTSILNEPDEEPVTVPVSAADVGTDMDEAAQMLTREQKIDRALDIYIHTPRGCGLGHSALMALGRRLSNAGLNFGEVRYQMEAAIRARPRENARAEIAAVIKTLIRTPFLRAG